jgi:oxygen-independent coproporphyrinogen III oxidase
MGFKGKKFRPLPELMPGLYLHIPFCRQACAYCDFHFSTNLERRAGMVEAMCLELEERRDYLADKNLGSVYFGGGTPSVLQVSEVEKLLGGIAAHFRILPGAEVTFELNPEDADRQYLRAIRATGVNRLSIGIQSFSDSELKWMNRCHTAAQSVACVRMAQEAGFENISIDLIYGSRFQSEESWRETLSKAFSLDVPHISSYNLTIEGRTRLNNLLQKKQEPEVDSELSARLFDILMEETEKQGYQHYEISNFCKPGFMAVHNSSYWRGEAYIGVGPAAHSFNGLSRQHNVKSNTRYLQLMEQGKPYWEEETLSVNDQYNEYVLTRLRTSWGCSLDEIENRFGSKNLAHFMQRLKKHADYIVCRQGSVTLNRKGKHFADGIAADLFV